MKEGVWSATYQGKRRVEAMKQREHAKQQVRQGSLERDLSKAEGVWSATSQERGSLERDFGSLERDFTEKRGVWSATLQQHRVEGEFGARLYFG